MLNKVVSIGVPEKVVSIGVPKKGGGTKIGPYIKLLNKERSQPNNRHIAHWYRRDWRDANENGIQCKS